MWKEWGRESTAMGFIKKKGKFDSCHHNSVKLGFTLKIMPLNGMDFNMESNFVKL